MEETRCVNCGGRNVMRVEYGMPDDAMVARIEAGEILHGGCKVNGLTQSLFCLDCETRFDRVSTPEFIAALRQIKFRRNGESIDIVFEHENSALVMLSITQECQTTMVTNAKSIEQFIHCGLEFWDRRGYIENKEAGEWTLEVSTDSYFRNLDILSGNQDAPFAFEKWLSFLGDLPILG